jgi:hypothetical protein
MLENFLQRKAAIERLRASLFGAHLDSFVATLSGWGYGSTTVLNRLRLLRSFDQWLRQRSLVLVDLREAVVNLFLAERRDNGRLQNGQAKTIRQFLDHLRARGVVQTPEPATDESPLATLIRQYENYLKKERGLARRHLVFLPTTHPLGQPHCSQDNGGGHALLLTVPLPHRADGERPYGGCPYRATTAAHRFAEISHLRRGRTSRPCLRRGQTFCRPRSRHTPLTGPPGAEGGRGDRLGTRRRRLEGRGIEGAGQGGPA